MEKFLFHDQSIVTGVLSGLDRLVFRGSLLPLIRDGGMFVFLKRSGVRLLDFKKFVLSTSDRLKNASLAEAHQHGRPVHPILSSTTSKEDVARHLLEENRFFVISCGQEPIRVTAVDRPPDARWNASGRGLFEFGIPPSLENVERFPQDGRSLLLR